MSEAFQREIVNVLSARTSAPYPVFQTIARHLIDEARAGAFRLARVHILKELGDEIEVRVTLNGSVLLPPFSVASNNEIITQEGPAPTASGLLEIQVKRIAGAEIPIIPACVWECIA